MNRSRYIAIGLAILVLLGGAVIQYYRGKDSVPLVYASIPEETKQFLRDLGRAGGHVRVRFFDDPITDKWKDETNEGEDAGNGFFKIEDENFIIYYHNEAEGNAKANVTFVAAKTGIQPLADLFGKYFYPSDVNGRKLAFYICRDAEECRRLSGAAPSTNAIAYTSLYFSPSGTLCRGIFMLPTTFSSANWQPGDARSSLRVQQTVHHEMAHFVYFTSLDLSKVVRPPSWVTEGVAEFVSGAENRLREASRDRMIPLAQFESPDFANATPYDAYWIGYTAFRYFDEAHSREKVKEFIRLSYQNRVRLSIERSAGVSFDDFDRGWQSSIENN